MTFNPKKDFCDSVHAKPWVDISASSTFSAAITTALVLMQTKYFRSPDLGTAASTAFRLEGAKDLVEILMNLSNVKEVESTKPSGQNLTWGNK